MISLNSLNLMNGVEVGYSHYHQRRDSLVRCQPFSAVSPLISSWVGIYCCTFRYPALSLPTRRQFLGRDIFESGERVKRKIKLGLRIEHQRDAIIDMSLQEKAHARVDQNQRLKCSHWPLYKDWHWRSAHHVCTWGCLGGKRSTCGNGKRVAKKDKPFLCIYYYVFD